MAIHTWPAASSMPQCPILNGFSEQRRRNIAAFQGQVGPPRLALRSSAVSVMTSTVFRMTSSQLLVFYTFYEEQLQDGALPFEWAHPITGITYTWHFDGREAPKVERMTPNTHRVSFNLLRWLT